MHTTQTLAGRIGQVVDSNVHLWDQHRNPVFWLTDRTMVRDMLGDYDSLPDTYTLADYNDATAQFDVGGAIWSDAGAADPVAAADWVAAHNTAGQVIALVALGDPTNPGFEPLVQALRTNPLVTSVRIRLVPALRTGRSGPPADGGERLTEGVRLLADLGLVATIEAGPSEIGRVADLARRFPEMSVVLDHFGWPNDLSDDGRRDHLRLLRRVAQEPNVTTRIDAIGTIFGSWDTNILRPWLHGVVEAFGAERCMLGSDLPIETLRSTFANLYAAYDAIFDSHSDADRRLLFGETARRVYGAVPHSLPADARPTREVPTRLGGERVEGI
jgi:predicted TIM-barrel fold metal-dependent hydrolase